MSAMNDKTNASSLNCSNDTEVNRHNEEKPEITLRHGNWQSKLPFGIMLCKAVFDEFNAPPAPLKSFPKNILQWRRLKKLLEHDEQRHEIARWIYMNLVADTLESLGQLGEFEEFPQWPPDTCCELIVSRIDCYTVRGLSFSMDSCWHKRIRMHVSRPAIQLCHDLMSDTSEKLKIVRDLRSMFLPTTWITWEPWADHKGIWITSLESQDNNNGTRRLQESSAFPPCIKSNHQTCNLCSCKSNSRTQQAVS